LRSTVVAIPLVLSIWIPFAQAAAYFSASVDPVTDEGSYDVWVYTPVPYKDTIAGFKYSCDTDGVFGLQFSASQELGEINPAEAIGITFRFDRLPPFEMPAWGWETGAVEWSFDKHVYFSSWATDTETKAAITKLKNGFVNASIMHARMEFNGHFYTFSFPLSGTRALVAKADRLGGCR
jgi:hypothetical protein